MHRTTWALLASTALVAVGGLAACGDGSSTPTAGGTSCHTVTVDIGSFVFQPTPVTVHPCDRVVWKNTHDQAHTSTGNGTQSWSTGNIAPGTTSSSVVFAKTGTFTYLCALHPFMHGEVVVS